MLSSPISVYAASDTQPEPSAYAPPTKGNGRCEVPTTNYFRVSALLVAIVAAAVLAALLAVITQQAASAHPGHEPSAGWFQRCSLTKSRAFDPIVYPDRRPPVGHRHLFFGSTAISYDSGLSDLRAGGTTCRFEDGTSGGNNSSYWIPDLKLRDGTYASGTQINAYYKKGAISVDAHDIKRFPAGLKMVIRDRNNWQTQVRWFCSGLNGEGSNGKYTERPYDCNPDGLYPHVSARITFPQCGTGATNSRDHISHMAYAVASGCPRSHPREFPRLFITAKYDASRGAGSRMAGGEDPAPGFHADYFEAWQPGTQESFVDACIRGGINCRDGDRLP